MYTRQLLMEARVLFMKPAYSQSQNSSNKLSIQWTPAQDSRPEKPAQTKIE